MSSDMKDMKEEVLAGRPPPRGPGPPPVCTCGPVGRDGGQTGSGFLIPLSSDTNTQQYPRYPHSLRLQAGSVCGVHQL